ncbi:hypothetical protein [Thiobacter aerophilum]|uniref:Uncharacterized protein n=1 Tax=Thiobacter aerophilum TaxID=3121275 RepID=A0ABV0EFE9_9BURK
MPAHETPWSLEIVVAMLRAARLVTWLSLLFTAAALTPWLGGAPAPLRGMIVILGIGAIWYGVRIAIDAHLFRRLQAAGPDTGLDALDQALTQLGWMKPDKLGRCMNARIQGALRLVRWQVGLTLAQGLGIVTVFMW